MTPCSTILNCTTSGPESIISCVNSCLDKKNDANVELVVKFRIGRQVWVNLGYFMSIHIWAISNGDSELDYMSYTMIKMYPSYVECLYKFS